MSLNQLETRATGSIRKLLGNVTERIERHHDNESQRRIVETAVLIRLLQLGESQEVVAAWCCAQGGFWIRTTAQVRYIVARARKVARVER